MKKKLAGFGITAALVAALGIYVYGEHAAASGALEGSGTIEARNIRVGSKVGGRIAEVRVREGDRVKAGDLIVAFDDGELAGALDRARGRVAMAKAVLEKAERGYRVEEIEEARAAAAQASAQLEEARNGYRSEQIAQAQAERERARAEAVNAERQYRRMADLADQGIFARQQRDDAEAAWKMAGAAQWAAEQRAAELEHGYRREEVAVAEARYRQAAAVEQRLLRGNRAEDIAAARADLVQAEGDLRTAEARFRERHVNAPADVWVEVLDVRPGDLIAANAPIATLLERDQLYVRIFVPETRIGQVRLGQRAEVRVDSFPGRVFPAEVEQINQKAEFLPRNVQTREERVKLVYAVKVKITQDPTMDLKPGVPADVTLQ